MDRTAIFENQISSLKEIIQIQEKQINSHLATPEELLTEWRIKVYELLVKNSFLVKQNKEFENNLGKLNKEKEAYSKRNTVDLSQREVELSQVRNKLNLANIEKEDLIQKIQQLTAQNNSIREEHATIKTHYQELMSSQSQSFTDKISDLTTRLNEKEGQTRELSSRISNLEAKLRDEIAQKEAFESRVNEIKTELLDLHEELEKSNKAQKDAEKEKNEAKVQQRELAVQVKRLEGKLKEEIEEKATLESRINEMNAQIEILRDENEMSSRTHKDVSERIKNELRTQQNDLLAQIRRLEGKLREENTEKTNLELKISELNLQLSNLHEQLERSQNALRESEREKNELHLQQKERLNQTKQLENLKNQEIEDFRLKIQTLEAARQEELRTIIRDYETRIVNLEKNKNDEIHSLRGELREIRQSNEVEIEALRQQIEDLQETKISLSSQINGLLKIVEQKDKKLDKYKGQTLNTSQVARTDFGRVSTISKKTNFFDLNTPQTKITKRPDRDENKSPFRLTENKTFLGNTSRNNQSELKSRLEAVEKLASDILGDDDF